MTTILSLSTNDSAIWAAGPDGLFRYEENLTAVSQPEERLFSCCAIPDRVLVGGLPHVVAFSLSQAGDDWRAGWVDNVEASVLVFAADPEVEDSGIILAGTAGGGILRTVNRGQHWYTRNFGLETFTVLSIAWAPVSPEGIWPRWHYVFATTEEGIYLSPNAGRGWKRAVCDEAVYQAIAISPAFHEDGVVIAGTEESGLFRSTDKGHTFTEVEGAPQQVNALAATESGWLLSGDKSLWTSDDGITWSQVEGSEPALALVSVNGAVLAGGENGVSAV